TLLIALRPRIGPPFSAFLFAFFVVLFNDPLPPQIYTLSLHDALPILHAASDQNATPPRPGGTPYICTSISRGPGSAIASASALRSEEHTSELQSPCNLVCCLLLEKKKNTFRKLNSAFDLRSPRLALIS